MILKNMSIALLFFLRMTIDIFLRILNWIDPDICLLFSLINKEGPGDRSRKSSISRGLVNNWVQTRAHELNLIHIFFSIHLIRKRGMNFLHSGIR